VRKQIARATGNDIARTLSATEVLQVLPQNSIAALVRACRMITARKGQVLFVPGDAAAVYAVQRGRVAILARPEAGQEIEFFTRHRGELFGEASLWFAISSPPNPPANTLSIGVPMAPPAAPRSDLMFAGATGVWRTTNAADWSQIDQCPGGPCQLTRNRRITSFAFHPVQPCDAVNCTIYVSVDGLNVGPDGADPVPGHVFRSINSGFNWQDISAGLPDVPANDVVVHPTDPNTIFVATDMGIYRGTLSGGSWSWCPYMNGFPQTALVEDLSVHAESGLLRAFTYGRSAWEVQAFSIPDPAVKVDSDIANPPVTGVFLNSARISTGTIAVLRTRRWPKRPPTARALPGTTIASPSASTHTSTRSSSAPMASSCSRTTCGSTNTPRPSTPAILRSRFSGAWTSQ
jgi:hypothetical protein